MRAVGACVANICRREAQRWRLRAVDLRDFAVVGIRDEDIARSIDRHSVWINKSGAHRSLTGDAGATGGNLQHSAVEGIRDENIAGCVHRHTRRLNQSASDRDLAGSAGAAGRNFHNLATIPDEDITRSIDRH